MPFPSNPSDGDTYIRYGRTYEYEAALSMWKVKKSGIQLNELSDVDVDTTTPAVGDTLVWSGTKFVPDEINLLSVYQSELPLTGNVAGQMAYVADTSRLYIYTGAGWFNVALVNTNPTITVGPEGSYAFATDGTPIVLTLEAQDPEEVPIAWSYVVTSGALGSTATVQQEGNVFTITPSTDTEDAGEFSITFTASDGVNLATAVSSFTLAFNAADQYYNLNSLLLKTGSTAGLNNITFVDESTNSHTVTPTGDVYQGSYSPYSPAGWSVYFDGNGDYLRFPSNPDYAFGTGDFTIECWFYITAPLDENDALVGNDTTPGWQLSANTDGTRFNLMVDGSNRLLATETLNLNQWYHIAYCREGSTLYGFLNGVAIGTSTASSASTNFTNQIIDVGVNRGGTAYFPGYISNLRLIKGTALYTSGFTPSTEPLTPTNETVLLTCQSPFFVDNSSNNAAITINGDTKIVPFSPYLPSSKYNPDIHNGSAYFDGVNEYLTVSSSSDFAFGTGDFTFECWYNCLGSSPVSAVNSLQILDLRTAEPSIGPLISIAGSGSNYNIQYYVNGSTVIDGSPTSYNSWNHLAISRSSGTTKMFLNGTQIGSDYTDTNNYIGTTPTIGGRFAAVSGDYRSFYGYISDVRIVKGTAVYTSDFTPPTEPLTAISGTSLLLKMGNAGIYDEIGKNNINLVGNATTSTTQTKYNDTSMSFDGSVDYLSILNSAEYRMGSSNFTIEAWIYPTDTSSEHTVVSLYGYTSNRRSWSLGVYQGQLDIRYATTGTVAVTSRGGVITANQWYHIAYVRDGSSFKGYLNGTEVTSATATSAALYDNTVDPILIGAIGPNITGYFAGYISDVRITKGVARYTANFTPPTSPLGFSNAE